MLRAQVSLGIAARAFCFFVNVFGVSVGSRCRNYKAPRIVPVRLGGNHAVNLQTCVAPTPPRAAPRSRDDTSVTATRHPEA